MPPAVFEPTIAASKRPQTHASDGAVTGTGIQFVNVCKYSRSIFTYFIVKKMKYNCLLSVMRLDFRVFFPAN